MYRHSHQLFLILTYLLVALVILARVVVENGNVVIPHTRYRQQKMTLKKQKKMQDVIRRSYITSYKKKLRTNYSPSSKGIDLNNSLTMQVAEILNFTKGGFFVEYSISDGIDDSNTVLLERDLNWTGLLIQAPPKVKKKNVLARRNRHAWVGDFCLSITPRTTTAMVALSSKRKLNMTCFPLEMALGSLKQTEVDYLSLNSKGVTNELDIIGSFPFHKIKVKVLSVEENRSNRRAIKWFLESKGFERVKIKKLNAKNMNKTSDWRSVRFGLYKNVMKPSLRKRRRNEKIRPVTIRHNAL